MWQLRGCLYTIGFSYSRHAIGAALAGCHVAQVSTTLSDIYNPVTLEGYGIFSGTTINETLKSDPLPQVVDAWLGTNTADRDYGRDDLNVQCPEISKIYHG